MKSLIQLSIVSFLISMFFAEASIDAQLAKSNPPGATGPRGCEFNNLALERANLAATQDSVLMLIAIQGAGDTKSILSRRRLYTARAYLVEYSKLRNGRNIVTAVAAGMQKSAYGGVEIYVNGQLFDTLSAKPNRDLGLGSCDSPDSDDKVSRERRSILYPWIYKNHRKGLGSVKGLEGLGSGL